MTMMNQEQAKSSVRWLLAICGAYLSSHGYVESFQLEMFSGIVMSAVPFVWSMFTHTQDNAIAVVATIAADPASPVKAPILENTQAGRALASSIKSANPAAVVAVAGSNAAAQMAGDPEHPKAAHHGAKK